MEKLSKHARKRCQQRGIDQELVNMLLSHGDEIDCDNSAVKLAFSQQAIKQMRKRMKRLMRVLETSPYIILGNDGTVITAAHQFEN